MSSLELSALARSMVASQPNSSELRYAFDKINTAVVHFFSASNLKQRKVIESSAIAVPAQELFAAEIIADTDQPKGNVSFASNQSIVSIQTH